MAGFGKVLVTYTRGFISTYQVFEPWRVNNRE
jgi:hypothetical protein